MRASIFQVERYRDTCLDPGRVQMSDAFACRAAWSPHHVFAVAEEANRVAVRREQIFADGVDPNGRGRGAPPSSDADRNRRIVGQVGEPTDPATADRNETRAVAAVNDAEAAASPLTALASRRFQHAVVFRWPEQKPGKLGTRQNSSPEA